MIRKFFTVFLAIFGLNSSFFSQDFYSQWTIENGLEVYVLEDFSSATINVEYAVKAGISSQSTTNTGYFPLYTNLFKYGSTKKNEIKDLIYECNSDSSRYRITTTPASIEKAMDQLSSHAFAPVWTDMNIAKELSELKTNVMEYANSPAAFINASIDARVFSAAPWKQDSGIYPALFNGTTPSKARTILAAISKNWYVPQNSAVFISGCIKKEAALELVKKTFGRYGASSSYQTISPVPCGGQQRKFVLYDSEFSQDITQIVVEYTSLSMYQSDVFAQVCNFSKSKLKTNLLGEKMLNIRDAEYINASAAHKNGSSRVIIQALLEKNKNSSCAQAEKFLSTVKKACSSPDSGEYESAKNTICRSFNQIKSNPQVIADYLSQYWAVENITKDLREEENADSSLLDRMLMHNQNILELSSEKIADSIKHEQPFVFVLVHTKDYNKYQKEFKKAGYTPINRKNGSWYTQKLFQNASADIQQENNYGSYSESDSMEALSRFIRESRISLTHFELANGIPVTVKSNKSTTKVLVMIDIAGGKLGDSGNPGFENVMADAFASNIQEELNKLMAQNLLESDSEVLAQTFLTSSKISIECEKDDIGLCIKAICDALIFGEISPASADSYVYSVKTQKRMWDASPVNQLTFRAVKYFYDSAAYRDAFDSDKDILENINYTDILDAYPKFLNSSLYSITVVGNTDEIMLKEQLENSLGLLKKIDSTKSVAKKSSAPDFPKSKRLSVALRHLFYTDIAAEDAGPMPAVLVPTKNFSDPVQYWFCPPNFKNVGENHRKAVLFNAVMYRFKDFLEEENSGFFKEIKITAATDDFPATSLTFLNVDHYGPFEDFFAKAKSSFLKNLFSEEKQKEEIKLIKNAWILNNLKGTGTNRGTALLLSQSKSGSENYLDDYETILNASASEFAEAAKAALPDEVQLRLYSQDAKK